MAPERTFLFDHNPTLDSPSVLPGEQAVLVSGIDVDAEVAAFQAELESLPTVHDDQLDLLPEHSHDQLALSDVR